MSDTSQNDQGPELRAFGRGKPTAGVTPKISSPQRGFRVSRSTVVRVSILALAAASGWAAMQIASIERDIPPQALAAPAPPPVETEDVLVTGAALPLGKVIAAGDVAWVAWPKKFVTEQAIRRSVVPNAREETIGALVRTPMLKGEPVRTEKIVRANGAGVLAAMLPSGYRAMAITIDAQGATTAGGFIMPNDRVDVIRTVTRSDPQRPGEGRVDSETLIANVRVLAIGQNIQERNGERVVTGSNATLEVDPAQAELLAQAQRSGQISLALRSIADAGDAPATLSGTIAHQQKSGAADSSLLTVGVMRGGKRQEYSVRDGRD